MLPSGDQLLRFVQHAVKLEARLSCEAKDLWRLAVKWESWNNFKKKRKLYNMYTYKFCFIFNKQK